MAKLTYNERFTNVQKYIDDGSYTGIQIVSKLNPKNGQDYKRIDSIDIDWNGAFMKITGSYINHTYELLDAIDNMVDLDELAWVKDQVDYLIDEVDTILTTYVTKEELNEILKGYEKPLTAGAYVAIDSENVISAYGFLNPDEAAYLYATNERVDSVEDDLHNNYFVKDLVYFIAEETADQRIQSTVIKNADKNYNDLEKISNWILSQPGDITGNIDEFRERLNRLDDVVGYAIYDPDYDAYSYSGLIRDVNILDSRTNEINSQVIALRGDVDDLSIKTTQAYNTAVKAYDYATSAYEYTVSYAMVAYNMAYTATETIGKPYIDSYFVELTEEDIALLNEDPNAIQVYAIRPDNLSGIPLPDVYNPDDPIQYYKFIDTQEATGFYKALIDMESDVAAAKESADNALFRLRVNNEGSSYAYIKLTPFDNDGSNVRFINFTLNEADIDSYTGEIINAGIITTYSLSNALSYALTFDIIECDNPEHNN